MLHVAVGASQSATPVNSVRNVGCSLAFLTFLTFFRACYGVTLQKRQRYQLHQIGKRNGAEAKIRCIPPISACRERWNQATKASTSSVDVRKRTMHSYI